MKAPVTIGDLRHRVQIETAARTSDGGGGAVITWTQIAEVWAAIWPRSNDEQFESDRMAGKATHDIWIRFRSDVKPEMRIRFGARVFDVRGVIDVEDRSRWLKCPCVERDL
ncbi:MAG: phage head closure protein [Hyphomicrobium sp.]|nr:phage head closure protein [Hyphomicrobium sp.]